MRWWVLLHRLEELNEKRQSMVQRVKIAEKERDGLAAEKTGGWDVACWVEQPGWKECRGTALTARMLLPWAKALTVPRAAAEAYLSKERECLGAQSLLAQIMVKDCKVCWGRAHEGLSCAQHRERCMSSFSSWHCPTLQLNLTLHSALAHRPCSATWTRLRAISRSWRRSWRTRRPSLWSMTRCSRSARPSERGRLLLWELAAAGGDWVLWKRQG